MTDIDAEKFDDELLSAYLDDELTPEERLRVEQRLSTTPAARQLLEELRAVSRTMQALPPATLDADLRESVLRRAERAMLVTGERAAARGENQSSRRVFPIGRSKRAWFWAGAALAAGVMLMVFERMPDQNRNLPGQVAERGPAAQDKKEQNEPRAPLTVRALEAPPGEAAHVDELSPPATSAPTLSSRADRSVAMRDRVLESPAAQATAPSAAVGGALAMRDKPAPDAASPEDLLVVHVNMKPEAMQNKAFDKVLFDNQIPVEEQAEEEIDRSNTSKPAESQNVDVVLVEASPSQVFSCLSDLKKDEANYLGIAVDDRLASSSREQGGKRLETDLAQYNRGSVPDQPQVEVAPDNNLNIYYSKKQGSYLGGRFATSQDVDERERFGGTVLEVPSQSRAIRIAPLAKSSDVDRGNIAAYSAAPTASPTNSSGTGQLSDDLRQNLAGRALQKLPAKGDTLQVLFVFQCPTKPAQQAAPPAEESSSTGKAN